MFLTPPGPPMGSGLQPQDRYRNRNQQSMRAADRERHHLLQFRYSVPATGEVRGELELKSPGLDQENVAGGLAAHPLERPLYFLWQRAGY